MQKPQHFVARRNPRGGWRFYWQPSRTLKLAGWQSRRLDGGKNRQGVAMRQAEEMNRRVADWRAGAGVVQAAVRVPDLVADFLAAPAFGALAGSTRRQYRGCLDRIAADFADDQVLAVTADRCAAWYAAWHVTAPAAAAQGAAVLRRLFAHGVRIGWLETNPAAALQIVAARRRELIWSADQVEHLVATADAMGWPTVGTAALIGFFVGPRERDILDMTRFNYAGGVFRVKCRKTGRLFEAPQVPRLARRLAGQVAGAGPLLVYPRTGRAWNDNTFRQVFGDVRAQAAEDMPGIAALQFRDLRRTAICNLYRAGATVPEVATITGHSIVHTQRVVDIYFVRHPDLARSAMVKLSDMEIAK